MPDIRKRQTKSGPSWQVRYEAQTATGYAYASFGTRAEAVAFVKSLSTLPAPSAPVPASTVCDALRSWLETVERHGRNGREPVSQGTLRKYRERANNHLVPLAGDMPITDLDAPRADLLRRQLLERCARATAAKCLSDIRAAFEEAVVRGEIAANPFGSVRIRNSARQTERIAIPTVAEMAAIERAMRAMRDHADGRVSADWARTYPMLLVLRWTGCRPEECRALRVDDLLWRRPGRPDAIRIVQAADESGAVGPTKTAAGRRTVGMPEPLRDALANWLMIRDSASDLLFPTRGGKPVSLANLSARGWKVAIAAAGVQDRHLYALRHYRVSERLAAGEDPQLVAMEVGHASAGFTLARYGHFLAEGLE